MAIGRKILMVFGLIVAAGANYSAVAAEAATATVGVQGYDLVSYHSGKPHKGVGHHVSVFDGTTYLFATPENKEAFEADPAKYLPAYGGYCAFGVTKGKKFFVDPLAWHIENGRLYLNLDKNVQNVWLRDVPGNIGAADEIWTSIKDVPAADL